jgi:4-hydroxy-tetrahydrodipicolinate reductase
MGRSEGLIALGILGAGGRMGRMLLQETLQNPRAKLVGGAETKSSPHLGMDLGHLIGGAPLGIIATDDTPSLFAQADAVIDFTHPDAVAHHASLARDHGKALIVGTTGIAATGEKALRDAATSIPIVWSANMSVGITLLALIVEQLAGKLDARDFDIEIVEMHHRYKIDAPSGTALALAQAAAQGRGVALPEVIRKSRDGQVGQRKAGEIGVMGLRGGDVVGDHTVMFAADGERLELTHKASSRQVFARGAVHAALWAAGQPPGLYGMKDVLGL